MFLFHILLFLITLKSKEVSKYYSSFIDEATRGLKIKWITWITGEWGGPDLGLLILYADSRLHLGIPCCSFWWYYTVPTARSGLGLSRRELRRTPPPWLKSFGRSPGLVGHIWIQPHYWYQYPDTRKLDIPRGLGLQYIEIWKWSRLKVGRKDGLDRVWGVNNASPGSSC